MREQPSTPLRARGLTFVYFPLHLGGVLKLELRVPVGDPPLPREINRDCFFQL